MKQLLAPTSPKVEYFANSPVSYSQLLLSAMFTVLASCWSLRYIIPASRIRSTNLQLCTDVNS